MIGPTIESLALASRLAREALVVRDRLIRQARGDGATLRQIARAADMTPQGVKLICDRNA